METDNNPSRNRPRSAFAVVSIPEAFKLIGKDFGGTLAAAFTLGFVVFFAGIIIVGLCVAPLNSQRVIYFGPDGSTSLPASAIAAFVSSLLGLAAWKVIIETLLAGFQYRTLRVKRGVICPVVQIFNLGGHGARVILFFCLRTLAEFAFVFAYIYFVKPYCYDGAMWIVNPSGPDPVLKPDPVVLCLLGLILIFQVCRGLACFSPLLIMDRGKTISRAILESAKQCRTLLFALVAVSFCACLLLVKCYYAFPDSILLAIMAFAVMLFNTIIHAIAYNSINGQAVSPEAEPQSAP